MNGQSRKRLVGRLNGCASKHQSQGGKRTGLNCGLRETSSVMGVKTENGPKFSFNHSALLLDTQAAKTKGKITVNFMLCPTVLK